MKWWIILCFEWYSCNYPQKHTAVNLFVIPWYRSTCFALVRRVNTGRVFEDAPPLWAQLFSNQEQQRNIGVEYSVINMTHQTNIEYASLGQERPNGLCARHTCTPVILPYQSVFQFLLKEWIAIGCDYFSKVTVGRCSACRKKCIITLMMYPREIILFALMLVVQSKMQLHYNTIKCHSFSHWILWK